MMLHVSRHTTARLGQLGCWEGCGSEISPSPAQVGGWGVRSDLSELGYLSNPSPCFSSHHGQPLLWAISSWASAVPSASSSASTCWPPAGTSGRGKSAGLPVRLACSRRTRTPRQVRCQAELPAQTFSAPSALPGAALPNTWPLPVIPPQRWNPWEQPDGSGGGRSLGGGLPERYSQECVHTWACVCRLLWLCLGLGWLSARHCAECSHMHMVLSSWREG